MRRMSACTALELLFPYFESPNHCVACHKIFLLIVGSGIDKILLTSLVLYPLLFYVVPFCHVSYFLSAVQ